MGICRRRRFCRRRRRKSARITANLHRDLERVEPFCFNDSKTEFTKIYLANKDDVDEKGEPLKHTEEWRKSKSLGSKLCSKTDILLHCNLGNLAFQNFKKIWMQGPKINLKTKLKIYEAQVTSVMLYNCNSWAATQKELHKLDVTQRKHLRHIIGMQWPKSVISNDAP